MKLINRIITTDRTPVFIGNDALSSLNRFITTIHPGGMKYNGETELPGRRHHDVFILVDSNTRKYCLPLLLDHALSLENVPVLEIPGGEDSKYLSTAEHLWSQLLELGADRNSLLINLGGGVVSDLGGFVAAGYKRGINYINIPTTLMGQADAAIGGKTGVNIGHVKNQVGFFYASRGVFIFPGFLKTLPVAHLRSGLAEIIKGVLISNASLWSRLIKHPVAELLQRPVDTGIWPGLILESVKFKNKVVMQDYRERKQRKALNFGHTIGHALEGFSHTIPGKQLMHGDAVAAGMICAAFLSNRKTGLSQAHMESVVSYLREGFPPVSIEDQTKAAILELITHDKKNLNGLIRFTLISQPGSPVINVSCSQEEILEALASLTV